MAGAVVVLKIKILDYHQAVQADKEGISTEGRHPCCRGSGASVIAHFQVER